MIIIINMVEVNSNLNKIWSQMCNDRCRHENHNKHFFFRCTDLFLFCVRKIESLQVYALYVNSDSYMRFCHSAMVMIIFYNRWLFFYFIKKKPTRLMILIFLLLLFLKHISFEKCFLLLLSNRLCYPENLPWWIRHSAALEWKQAAWKGLGGEFFSCPYWHKRKL